jgi:aminopeptidase N
MYWKEPFIVPIAGETGGTNFGQRRVFNGQARAPHAGAIPSVLTTNGLRRFYGDRKFQKAGTDDFQRAMETASGRSLDRFFDRWIHGADLPVLNYSSAIRPGEVVVRFDQDTRMIFDVPVTVTLQYADGHLQDVIVPVSDAHVEQRIPTAGIVREVQINRDSAALARFSEN